MAFDFGQAAGEALAIWQRVDRLTRALEKFAPRDGSSSASSGPSGVPAARFILTVLDLAVAAAEHPVATGIGAGGTVALALVGVGLLVREVVR